MSVRQASDLVGPQTLDDEIDGALRACRNAIRERYDHISLPASAPRSPQAWFALLWGFVRDQNSLEAFGTIVTDAEGSGDFGPGTLELYAVLQAYLMGLPQLHALPIHDSVKRQYCMACRRIANNPDSYPRQFGYRTDAFHELARIVSHRSFHAGQISFNIMAMPRTWLLRAHPLALPGLLHEIVFGVGGIGPLVTPHVNYWRGNPGLLFEKENERAFWRIAKTIEMRPEIKGLTALSWLNCREVATASPHLGFVREFYLNNGAYLVDMNVAPSDSGFRIGNAAREGLYDQGEFRPRETLVLWRRAHILDWARKYESGQGSRRSTKPASTAADLKPYWQFDANKTLSSGRFTLLNWEPMLTRKPRRYATLVFLLPCLVAVTASALLLGVAAIIPVGIGAVVIMWLLQYFILQ
jgi:hypothetical protein